MITARWNDTWRQLARRARVAVLPAAVVTPATAGVRVVLASARVGWPVLSGRSKAGLAEEQKRDGDLVQSVGIVDPVGYTLAVRKGQSWRSLVAEPMRRLVRDLADQAGNRAVSALRRT